MHTKIAEGLVFHYMRHTDTIGMWYNGTRIPRIKENKLACSGSRQFFRVGPYFIKAEEANPYSQCANEAWKAGKIRPKDQQYFAELLACSDFGADEPVHWTMFPFYKLRRCTNSEIIQVCRKQVKRLCYKYNIYDVVSGCNINWFVRNGRPFIVDYGVDGYR